MALYPGEAVSIKMSPFFKIPAIVAWLLLSSVLLYDELASLLASQFIRQLKNRNWGEIPTRLQISLNVLGILYKFLVQIFCGMALCGWMNSPRCLEGFGTYETSANFRLSSRCHITGDFDL